MNRAAAVSDSGAFDESAEIGMFSANCGNRDFNSIVGLSGEIRPVAQTERRIIEAARLGFRKVFVSGFSSLEGLSDMDMGNIEVVKVGDVPALCRALFKPED